MPGVNTNSNVRSQPVWAADYLSRDHLVPAPFLLNAAAFNRADDVVVTVGAAGAAVDATTVPVDATTGAIPSGTVISFGGKKFARLTADAAAGATSLTVSALATALVDNDTGTYSPNPDSKKRIPAGTLVGRTYTERGSNASFEAAATGDDETFLIAFDVPDVDEDNSFTAVRPGTYIKENKLPNWASYSTALKTLLRLHYRTEVGAE